MTISSVVRKDRHRAVGIFTILATVASTGLATAGPVVREAAGANAAAIQAAVDLFRSDLGGANNGNTAGSQLTGRREINWDGGGAAANATTFPTTMTTFANRGAIFVTSGTGFEISGQPTPEFGDLNPTYPNQFASFSSPRLFTPLNTNVHDVLFSVPGTGAGAVAAVPAASTGFGAVFTDVDSATSTKMEFYTPDGELLYERFVPAAPGNDTLSFLGVSFNAGEVVGWVRITSGNTAPGPDDDAIRDVVVMDDFIYGEPVSTAVLISPPSGSLFRQGAFDIVVSLEDLPAGFASGKVSLDGYDITVPFLACVAQTQSSLGGSTIRCQPPRGFLAPGEHTLQIELTLTNNTRVRHAVLWKIVNAVP